MPDSGNIMPGDDEAAIEAAVQKLEQGGLVAMPTETVYGLAANALDDKAVAAVYAAKARSNFNPLIIHLSGLEAAGHVVQLNPLGRELIAAFWPGPLTIVAPRLEGAKISPIASAGLDSLAVRAPDHRVAQALLKRLPFPLVAPSANTSGKLSPTTARHIAEDLGEKVDIILDGGPSPIGIESSVLDTSGSTPRLLRAGAIPLAEIEAVIGPVETSITGTGAAHYVPQARLVLNQREKGTANLMIGFGEIDGDWNLSEAGDVVEAAANLFDFLHRADETGATIVAIAAIPDEGIGAAINQRLIQAARGVPE